MNIQKCKIVKNETEYLIIRDERKKAIVLKEDIKADGYFQEYICKRSKKDERYGTPGWQVFNFNAGFEKYAKENGVWYGDTMQEAIDRITRTPPTCTDEHLQMIDRIFVEGKKND